MAAAAAVHNVSKLKQHWQVEKNVDPWPQQRVVLDGQNDVYVPMELPLRGRLVPCKLLPTTIMKREDMPESLLAWLEREQAGAEQQQGQ
eukprot:CAMPEP_0171240252 /NCGR_PEP_ID=MMETSP0790-20130122/44402_1 /TAXON_ID=2925 /ORGANISM="Alexandrium catenella, Strain OF101" /LENGTH=88 /DNA_ID=CAMNT_0011706661 /DNA_START=57 /DNA_END=323 /DNA_ORIENTATION=+